MSAGGGRGGHKALKASVVTPKTFVGMNRTANGIKGVLETLSVQLQVLETEIQMDEKGKHDFERDIGLLEKRRDELQKRVDDSLAWAGQYDTDIGPFEAKYKAMTGDIGNLYDTAKQRHKEGITLLKREFNYHPEFKRSQDTFSATPFMPK